MNLAKLLMRTLLGKRLPITEGTVVVDGPLRPVTIRRDRYGIPHIAADSDADAFFGLGFCQGQDRTFQIEALSRVVRGTVAELVGPDALPIDRLARRIGFRRAGEATLAELDTEVREAAVAFAAGVNAGSRAGLRRRPHEFVLLRERPGRFEPADVTATMTLQSFALAANWDVELARLQVLRADGPEALAAIDPAYPDWLPVSVPPGEAAGPAADRLVEELRIFQEATGAAGGSNNWAIAAERTATGRPMLANDPHLAPLLPPHWYLCHLITPEWSVAGAALTGTPAIAVGHNGYAAWGVTAGLVDNTDLYVEQVGPDGRSVRRADGYLECEVRTERINVKGGEPVDEVVLVTDRGPIIGPALDGEVGAISLQATWLHPARVRGLLALQRVRSFDEFRESFRRWNALSLNVAYADRDGTIGSQLIGEAPQRRAGGGMVPLPGWAGGVGWLPDPVPYDEMPHVANPATGYVATANNKPASDGPYLGSDWIDGYRVARITEVLAGRDDWDVDGCLRLQVDQLSIPWREMRDTVLRVIDERPAVWAAAAELRDWDGVLAAASSAAALYELFVAGLSRRVVAAKAPRSTAWALGKGFTPLVPHTLFALRRMGLLTRLLNEQPDGWFSRPWDDEIADALLEAASQLEAAGGRDTAWGEVRPLTLRHALGGRKPLDRIYNLGPFPWGGDADTVAQASPDPAAPAGGVTIAIASLRMVADVGDWERCRFVLPGGQSGNPLSPHYADQLGLWRAGDGVPIAWSEEAVAAAAHASMRLQPRR